jgi:tetratricopeptide (TPR) repeat protein
LPGGDRANAGSACTTASKTAAISGLGGLGTLYQALNRTTEAEPLFKRALSIKEKALGSDHLEVADALHDLAECYRKQSRLSEAEPLYLRALSTVEAAGSLEHPAVTRLKVSALRRWHWVARRCDREVHPRSQPTLKFVKPFEAATSSSACTAEPHYSPQKRPIALPNILPKSLLGSHPFSTDR